MGFLLFVFFSLCIVCITVSLYIILRNEWVFKQRMKAIDEGYYESLPSYGYMLYEHPFCWNIGKFIF